MNATTANNGHPHTTRLRIFCAQDPVSRIGGAGLGAPNSPATGQYAPPFVSGVAASVATLPGGVMAVFQEPLLEVQRNDAA